MNTVSICCTIRQHARFVAPFVAQFEALSRDRWRIGTLNLVCDGERLADPHLLELTARRPEVRISFERRSDAQIETIEDKAAQWAEISNQAVESALLAPCTHLLYIEPDLSFPFDLVDQLIGHDLDVVAPIVFLGGGFYDSWGFRDLQGRKIRDFGPIAATAPPIELGSVGSCVLFRAGIFRRGVRFRGTYEEGLLVGVCEDARRLGFRVWADPSTSIVHPTSLWRAQTWRITRIEVAAGDRPAWLSDCEVAIAGHYPNFVAEFVRNAAGALFREAGGGLYDLTVTRHRDARTLALRFDRAPEDPGMLDEFRLSGRIRQVAA